MTLEKDKLTKVNTSPQHRFRNTQKMSVFSQQNFDLAYSTKVMGLYCESSAGRTIKVNNEDVTDFVRCSYLGLDNHPEVIAGAIRAIEKFQSIQWSCSRNRLNYSILNELENCLSSIWRGRAVVFTSVTLANLAGISLLASGLLTMSIPSVVAFDERCHASLQILRPLVADETNVEMVSSGDYDCLEALCKKYQKVVFVTDGVNSMGGTADIKSLISIQNRYDLTLYIDDAHGISIQGNNGCGYTRSRISHDLGERIILAISLAKGFGASGGALLVGTKKQEEAIRRYAPSYGFSAIPSVPAVGAALGSASVHMSEEIYERQREMLKRIETFDSNLPTEDSGNGLPIRFVRIGNEERVIRIVESLFHSGFYVMAAFFPTVERGKAGIRVSITSEHPLESIKKLTEALHRQL
jgi:7-keto-8-aminopelargonate synthetase-like enzyme